LNNLQGLIQICRSKIESPAPRGRSLFGPGGMLE